MGILFVIDGQEQRLVGSCKDEDQRKQVQKLSEPISKKFGSSIALDAEKREEIERVFRRFDVNDDSKISSKELGDVLRALGTEVPADEVKRMMEEMDTDGNGFIDLKESNFLSTFRL
ncbi:PREDICTED: polcalcin Syr v 3-like [Nelumbo nucifera]|uniref:Polcalcin Syr v 3-like n=1 Tax=Nelumbo nucifera TaxID=4432 RepID=A0A1U8Q9D4_NELNU|nr:PREDICTED: polcalcin Syr v 3-like [Nelumbo nucifera]